MTQPIAEFNPELELWFVTGSQALYGDEALETVAAQSQQVFQQLASSLEGVISMVWKPVLTTPDAIKRQLLDATATDTCVGVVAWMHTFSPAKMWISGLLALDKPLLHLHTQLNLSLPWSEIDMDFMNLNQAAHGDREFAHITTRLGLPRTVVVGHVGDTRVSERVASWARATTGWHAARSLKLARFGDNMRDVAVTEGDKVEAQAKLGISVNTYAVHDLAIAVNEVESGAVDRLVEAYADSYSLDQSLQTNGGRHASLRYEARVELALRSLLLDGRFSAFTTNFEDLGALEQLPGLAVQRLMADGYGFGAEGDWKTAALLRILKVMGAGREGGASFMEDYTYHLGPGEPRILGAHMLEVCPSIAMGQPTCEIHPLAIGDRGDPVRLVFDAKPGPALVVGLVDLGDRLRLVANQVNIVAPNEPLKRLPSARAVWAPEPSLAVSAECWLLAGGPHHTVLTTSVDADCLAEFAEITQIELVMIDNNTSPRRFRDEERWNRAYWRLAKPI